MKHLDLFSGIGGFAYAIDQVWEGVEHTFCDNDLFCQQVLKKHWPNSQIYGDIRKINGQIKADIVTGGFPCQPFSQAGQKKGTEDERHLWPEMFRVIQLAKPKYVIGENVSGLITWGEGLVLETVCTDLESQGYKVQPFIIPACSVGAPHRRNRVWIVAYSESKRWNTVDKSQQNRCSKKHFKGFDTFWRCCSDLHLAMEPDWLNPSSGVRRNDDGLSEGVDRLKSLGNAIVPQVAIEIFKSIREIENQNGINRHNSK